MLRMTVPPRNFCSVLCLSLAFLIGFSSLADAQDQRARRRAFVEDLLRGLIDSQTPEQPNRGQGHNHGRPVVIPGNTPQPKPRPKPVLQPVAVKVTPTMIKARKSLGRWNTTCGQLIEEIRVSEYDSPQLRPLLGDALKVQANISSMCRKSQQHPNLAPLMTDFKNLDSDWRMLSYRLNSTGFLNKKCSRLVESISAIDQELCGMFRVEPQINRREIRRLATKLSTDYDHLLHDLHYVCRSHPNGRKLVAKGQVLQTMIGQTCALIDRGSYDSIVKSYDVCLTKWKGFHREIHPFEDERIRHTVGDLETTAGLIREQLWLPVELDREYLGSLADVVAVDSGKIFNSITLATLLECKSPGLALSSAREFQNSCGRFSNSITSGASIEDLEWDYRLFEVQWNQMHNLFQEFGIPKVDHRLEDIAYSMQTLKGSFGAAPLMNHGQLRQLSSNLGALFQQTAQDVHGCVIAPAYDGGFQQQIYSAVDQCNVAARQLNQHVVRNPNIVLGPTDLAPLTTQWRTLKPLINQCQDADKRRLLQMRSQIEPLMVKLQVVFAE